MVISLDPAYPFLILRWVLHRFQLLHLSSGWYVPMGWFLKPKSAHPTDMCQRRSWMSSRLPWIRCRMNWERRNIRSDFQWNRQWMTPWKRLKVSTGNLIWTNPRRMLWWNGPGHRRWGTICSLWLIHTHGRHRWKGCRRRIRTICSGLEGIFWGCWNEPW